MPVRSHAKLWCLLRYFETQRGCEGVLIPNGGKRMHVLKQRRLSTPRRHRVTVVTTAISPPPTRGRGWPVLDQDIVQLGPLPHKMS